MVIPNIRIPQSRAVRKPGTIDRVAIAKEIVDRGLTIAIAGQNAVHEPWDLETVIRNVRINVDMLNGVLSLADNTKGGGA